MTVVKQRLNYFWARWVSLCTEGGGGNDPLPPFLDILLRISQKDSIFLALGVPIFAFFLYYKQYINIRIHSRDGLSQITFSIIIVGTTRFIISNKEANIEIKSY